MAETPPTTETMWCYTHHEVPDTSQVTGECRIRPSFVVPKDGLQIVIGYTGSTNSLTGHPSPQCSPMHPEPGVYVYIGPGAGGAKL